MSKRMGRDSCFHIDKNEILIGGQDLAPVLTGHECDEPIAYDVS